MEDNNILDINNAVHMFSLQYIFAGRINRDLIVWSQSHNSHGVRTERYQTPLQLWYAGSINNQERDMTAMNNLFRRDTDDIEETTNNFIQEPSTIRIVLPRYTSPLTNSQLRDLDARIDTLQVSESQGVDLYADAVRFINLCNRRS